MTSTVQQTFADEWATWHRDREQRLTDPHGFLAVTSLTWLGEQPVTAPGAPGRWSAGSRGVVVALEAGEELVVDGAPVEGEHVLGELGLRESRLLRSGDLAVEVAERGGRYVVRVRDPRSPLLAAHAGTPAFPADPRWAATGRFVPFEAPQPTTVPGVLEGVEHVYDAPGTVEVTVDGHDVVLRAFPGHGDGDLTVLFSDATSGESTYAFRSLHLVPAADGRVEVDLNRAVNLPCAYTDLATCPTPPAENRLPFAVEAGERTPTVRGAARPTDDGAVLAG